MFIEFAVNKKYRWARGDPCMRYFFWSRNDKIHRKCKLPPYNVIDSIECKRIIGEHNIVVYVKVKGKNIERPVPAKRSWFSVFGVCRSGRQQIERGDERGEEESFHWN